MVALRFSMACRYCGVETRGENHGRMAECVDALRAETQRLSAQVAAKHRPAGDAEPVNRTKNITAESQITGEFSTRARARVLR
jgi:hypothetical protein